MREQNSALSNKERLCKYCYLVYQGSRLGLPSIMAFPFVPASSKIRTGNGGTGNGERGTGNGESLKGGISKTGNL